MSSAVSSRSRRSCRDFAEENPHISVTLFRFANVLGDNLDTPFVQALRLPIVPEILGFDPRLQFVHEDDVVGALMYATVHDVPGVYNVAGDGVVPWSEVCKIVSKRRVALPPVLTNWAAEPLRVMRILNLPPELLDLLRFGRGLDNTRFQRAGFRYRHTTAGAMRPSRWGCASRARSARRTPCRTSTSARSRTSSGTRRPSSAILSSRGPRRAPCTCAARCETITSRRSRSTTRSAATRPSADLVGEIVVAFDELEADDDVHAVVITGAGTVFCVGGDTSALARYASGESSNSERGDIAQVYEGFPRAPLDAAHDCRGDGPAVGAGLNLRSPATCGIAATSAAFDARFLRIGLHPGGGHLWLLECGRPADCARDDTVRSSAAERRGRGAVASRGCAPRRRGGRPAVTLAARAGSVPKSLTTRAKDTLRRAPWQPDFDAAVRTELEHQTWSFGQGWFGRRWNALRQAQRRWQRTRADMIARAWLVTLKLPEMRIASAGDPGVDHRVSNDEVVDDDCDLLIDVGPRDPNYQLVTPRYTTLMPQPFSDGSYVATACVTAVPDSTFGSSR